MSSAIFHLVCVFARCGSVADEDARVRRGSSARAAAGPIGFAATLLGAVAGLVCVVMLCASPALADSCPNAQFRTGPSASLPDCRAYEQVSPVDKSGGDVLPSPVLSTADGGSVAYASPTSFAGAPTSAAPGAYVATRGASWATSPLTLAEAPSASIRSSLTLGVSGDLTKSLVETNAALAPGAVEGHENLYVHDTATGSDDLVASVPNPCAPSPCPTPVFRFIGADQGGSHFVFWYDNGSLPSNPPSDPSSSANLYDYDLATGELRLVGVLPNGTPDPSGSWGALPACCGWSPAQRAVSADASRIYWREPSGVSPENNVYLNDGGHTTLVASPDAHFYFASRDGSSAFITSSVGLTPGASPSGSDLYRYDAGTNQLTDLTPDATDPGGAGVVGVFGSSDDGGYVYFLATGALASGAGAGQNNVFVWHDGSTRFIGDLASGASQVLSSLRITGYGDWRLSPDGKYFVLQFAGEIAGPHPQAAEPFDQVYRYSYEADSLVCVSCSWSGSPTGPATLRQGFEFTAALDNVGSLTRNVTNAGAVFFNSPDSLVASDTNGRTDVYEYEDGQVHLISTGRSDADSYFGDASADGSDVFFITRERLVGQDDDDNFDLYDARVGGGLASQNPPPPSPPCIGDGCKGAPTVAPGVPLAASLTFSGPGQEQPVAPLARVRVTKKAIRGTAFTLSVKVPAEGRISVTGAGVRSLSMTVAKAGTYKLKLTLTASAKRTLARHHGLKLTPRVGYAPASGTSSSATVTLTLKEPSKTASGMRHARLRRASLGYQGGVL